MSIRPQNRDKPQANSHQIVGRCNALKLIINEHFPLSTKTTKAKAEIYQAYEKRKANTKQQQAALLKPVTPTRKRDAKQASHDKGTPESHPAVNTGAGLSKEMGAEELQDLIKNSSTKKDPNVGKPLAPTITQLKGSEKGPAKR